MNLQSRIEQLESRMTETGSYSDVVDACCLRRELLHHAGLDELIYEVDRALEAGQRDQARQLAERFNERLKTITWSSGATRALEKMGGFKFDLDDHEQAAITATVADLP
jgi:hypothetical protein